MRRLLVDLLAQGPSLEDPIGLGDVHGTVALVERVPVVAHDRVPVLAALEPLREVAPVCRRRLLQRHDPGANLRTVQTVARGIAGLGQLVLGLLEAARAGNLLIYEAAVPFLVGRGVVMRHEAHQVPRVAVLPLGQTGQLLDGALGTCDIGTRLEAEQQAAVLGAALDVRNRVHALAVATVVGEGKGTLQGTLDRHGVLLEHAVEERVARNLLAEVL